MGFGLIESGSDANQFYSAARLAGTGHLYDFDRIAELELQTGGHPIPFGRLPVYAVLLKPLTVLPYRYAREAWLTVNLFALIGFAALWPVRHRREVIMMVCWSCPAAVLLATGQDTALFLFFLTAGLRLLQTRRDFAAGLVLSLCAAKFHLALGIPVFLLARRRWGALIGGLVGLSAQLAISFAAEGREWPARLLRLSAISDFSPSPSKMPNLLGLAHGLPYGGAIEFVLAIFVIAAVWIVSRRSPLTIGATAAVLGGLLVSHHAYVYDAVLLLPACALAARLPGPRFLRYGALALCVPIPYVLLIQERWTWVVPQVMVNGFGLALLWLLAFHGWRIGARTQASSLLTDGVLSPSLRSPSN
jgi:Glycosyltransferase family 87